MVTHPTQVPHAMKPHDLCPNVWNRGMQLVNVAEKRARFTEYWSPKIVGEVNDAYVKLVKLKGEFVWHRHEQEDELFFVLKGMLRMRMRGSGGIREELVRTGEFIIVARGVEHLPIAEEEAHVMLLEPRTTLNTGNVRNERTREVLDKL
jgi:mannose-6-phosphate isomerase-like protein (cupin superfamily)